jgi:hypothetical protein
MMQNLYNLPNTGTVAEIQRRVSFVCIQIELQGVRNVTWDCEFWMLQECHTKAKCS